MKETTGAEYLSSKFAKSLTVAPAKVGKTSFLTAALLGVLPWQKFGGIVDRPDHLHVITLDANAAGGLAGFLAQTCAAPAEALKFKIYNMQEEARCNAEEDYDRTLYNGIMDVINTVGDRAGKGGVHALLISSLTGLCLGLQRAVAGPAGKQKGGGMDQTKWQDFAAQVDEIRNYAQQDFWHCIWEGHIYKPAVTGQDGKERSESLQISGKMAYNFPMNCEQVFRIRREHGKKAPGSKCDIVYLDTAAALDFIPGGRSFTEKLSPKEYDPTITFKKLGLNIGRWGDRSK